MVKKICLIALFLVGCDHMNVDVAGELTVTHQVDVLSLSRIVTELCELKGQGNREVVNVCIQETLALILTPENK